MHLHFESATQLLQRLASKELSALELVDHFVARIERLDAAVNAVVVRDFERAREQARRSDDERARSEVVLKDLALGAEMAKSIADRAAWTKDRPAQQAVKRGELVEKVRAMLAARGG